MEEHIEVEGRIQTVLAGTMFRVELDNKHQVTKTGLETEELKRKERVEERRVRRESKRESKRISGLSGGTDLEKGNAEPAR